MNVSTLTNRLRQGGLRQGGLRRGSLRLFALAAAAALIFSACDLVGNDTEDEQQQQQGQAEQQEAQQQAAPAPAAAPAARPAATPPAPTGPPPPPEAAGGGDGATAYSIIFPSLVFVIAGDAVATGLVTSDGYVLVDERLLGGAPAADVHFYNGDVLEALPIVGRDPLTGLAYLGPLENSLVRVLPGARLGDGESIRFGSSVFTIGYSQTAMPGAQPGVYSGVLSGVEEWEPGARTLLRTDARPDGQTAGMILVDNAGAVIGVAPAAMVGQGWYISTGDLARSLPPAPLAATRALDPASASTEHVVRVEPGQRAAELSLSDEASGESVSLSILTETPAKLQLIDANGDVLQESSVIAGSTIISLALSTTGPYTLMILPDALLMAAEGADDAMDAMDAGATYTISASAPLMAMAEADAMTGPEINTPFVGAIDRPGDTDSFNLPIRGGAIYEIRAQSLLLDAVLTVEGNDLDAADDDAGGGPLGRDAALTLAPEENSMIRVTVKDYGDEAVGPYILTITQIGGEPPAEAMEEEEREEQMMAVVEAALPPPMGDLSLRGTITEAGLVPTLSGIGTEVDASGALLISDRDGIFEIIVSMIGRDGSTARVLVLDEEDRTVISGRVIITCASAEPCLASAVFITPEDTPSPAGRWRALIEPEGAAAGISEWQIEAQLYDYR